MATTTSGGGGSSPPAGGNGNANNGNLTGLNGLIESISDVNLTLLQDSSKFLSAKNSVELNKVKEHSIPRILHPSSLSDEAMEESSTAKDSERPIGRESSSGRSVHWFDIPSAQGRELPKAEAHSARGHSRRDPLEEMESSISSAVPPAKVKEEASHTSLYLQNPDPDDISVLHVRTGSRQFSLEDRMGNLDLNRSPRSASRVQNLASQKDSCGNHQVTEATELYDPERQNFIQLSEMLTSNFPIPQGIGGTPDSTSDDDESPSKSHVINRYDGLGMESNTGNLQDTSVFFTPTIQDYVTPSQEVTNTSYLESIGNPLSHITQVRRPDPVTVYYQEALTTAIPPTPSQPIGDHFEDQETPRPLMSPSPPDDNPNSGGGTYYDGDDDIDLDRKPEYRMPNVEDIPIPDPSYVRATVPESFRPLIAKTYKKDCRTWLWKSKTQREAVLRQQEEESDTSDSSTSNTVETELTQRISKLSSKA